MRESLTILAIALIVVLTTALVGPYFVNWNAHRAEVEQRLSTLLGAAVTVNGPIDVKLLPRPIFRFADVTVASTAPRAPAATAERLDVELALTALLRGEFVFVEADLAAPRLTLVQSADGTIVLPHFEATDPDHVSLDHVSVRDGVLRVVGEDGHPVVTLEGLSGEGDADSLAGPFRFAGTADTPRGQAGFRLATGALDGSRIRLKATLEEGAGLPRTEAEGTLELAPVPGGGTRASLEGTFASRGTLVLPNGTAVVPWAATGKVAADHAAANLTALEVRAGADNRALVLAGTGRMAIGAEPRGSFSLRGRQADLSRLALVPGDRPALAGLDPLLDGLAGLLADGDAMAALPFPTSLDVGLDALTLGQLTLGTLALHGEARPGAPFGVRLSAEAPDGSALALDGALETGPAAVFKGRVKAGTPDLGRLADSFAPDLPALARTLRGAVPAKAVRFEGPADVSWTGFSTHDATLALDKSRFAGTLTLNRAVGADRARLFADLTADTLDLDALPDWRAAAVQASDLDLTLTLVAKAVTLAQTDTGGVAAGRAALQLKKAGDAVTLERLSLADVGGATADLSGTSDGHGAHIEGTINARRLKDVLALAARLAPGTLDAALLARADALSPALLTVSGDATLDQGAAPRLDRLNLAGTAAGTAVNLDLAQNLAEKKPTPATGLEARLRLEAPDAGTLLRQIGVPSLPGVVIGRGTLAASGQLDDAFRPSRAEGTLTLADTVVTFKGSTADRGGLAGHVSLGGPNLSPLLRALSLASPDASAVWPVALDADIAGVDGTWTLDKLSGRALGAAVDGHLAYRPPTAPGADTAGDAPVPPALAGALRIDRLPLAALAALAIGPPMAPKAGALWSDTPFPPSLAGSLPRTAVALELASLPLPGSAVAGKARMDLALAPGVVTLSNLFAQLGGGRLAGSLALRRDGRAASLGGHVGWDGVPSASPAFGGRTRGELDVAGTGTSLAALVGSLGGTGTFGVDDARLPRFDAGALPGLVANGGGSTIDADIIRGDVDQALDKGALGLRAVSGPVTLAAGVLRFPPVNTTAGEVRTAVTGTLDLATLGLTLSTTATVAMPPKDWVGPAPAVAVTWSGSFAAPTRSVDAGALVNGLAARAIARDQARIEAFQDDVRERAFFARRLRAIEAEQQAAERDKARSKAESKIDDAAALDRLIQQQALPAPSFTAPPSRPAPRPTLRAPDAAPRPAP